MDFLDVLGKRRLVAEGIGVDPEHEHGGGYLSLLRLKAEKQLDDAISG